MTSDCVFKRWAGESSENNGGEFDESAASNAASSWVSYCAERGMTVVLLDDPSLLMGRKLGYVGDWAVIRGDMAKYKARLAIEGRNSGDADMIARRTIVWGEVS